MTCDLADDLKEQWHICGSRLQAAKQRGYEPLSEYQKQYDIAVEMLQTHMSNCAKCKQVRMEI